MCVCNYQRKFSQISYFLDKFIESIKEFQAKIKKKHTEEKNGSDSTIVMTPNEDKIVQKIKTLSLNNVERVYETIKFENYSEEICEFRLKLSGLTFHPLFEKLERDSEISNILQFQCDFTLKALKTLENDIFNFEKNSDLVDSEIIKTEVDIHCDTIKNDLYSFKRILRRNVNFSQSVNNICSNILLKINKNTFFFSARDEMNKLKSMQREFKLNICVNNYYELKKKNQYLHGNKREYYGYNSLTFNDDESFVDNLFNYYFKTDYFNATCKIFSESFPEDDILSTYTTQAIKNENFFKTISSKKLNLENVNIDRGKLFIKFTDWYDKISSAFESNINAKFKEWTQEIKNIKVKESELRSESIKFNTLVYEDLKNANSFDKKLPKLLEDYEKLLKIKYELILSNYTFETNYNNSDLHFIFKRDNLHKFVLLFIGQMRNRFLEEGEEKKVLKCDAFIRKHSTTLKNLVKLVYQNEKNLQEIKGLFMCEDE